MQVAPIRLRLLALLINISTAILVLFALIAGGAGLMRITSRLRRQQAVEGEDDPVVRAARPQADCKPVDVSAPHTQGVSEVPLAARLQSRRFRLGFAAASFIASVSTEGRQGFAARMLGIRLADARTGKQISRRQAMVRVGVRTAWGFIANRVVPRAPVASAEEHRELWRQTEEARRRSFGDNEARNEAIMRIYREHKRAAPAVWGCWLRLFLRVALSLLPELPALWSPRRQGLPDRLAGTVQVVEPRSGLVGRVTERLLLTAQG